MAQHHSTMSDRASKNDSRRFASQRVADEVEREECWAGPEEARHEITNRNHERSEPEPVAAASGSLGSEVWFG